MKEEEWGGPATWLPVIMVIGLLVLFVGLPLAVWWWVGDLVREWIRRDAEDRPIKKQTTIDVEDRECPY